MSGNPSRSTSPTLGDKSLSGDVFVSLGKNRRPPSSKDIGFHSQDLGHLDSSVKDTKYMEELEHIGSKHTGRIKSNVPVRSKSVKTACPTHWSGVQLSRAGQGTVHR